MTDAEQHLPVQLIDAPHRAVDAVRDLDRVRGGDAGGTGAGGGKECGLSLLGRPVCASIGHHAHFFDARGWNAGQKGRCSSSHDMLGMTSVPFGPRVSLERGDPARQGRLHRFDLREGAVDQQHAARLHAQGVG